MKNKSEKKEDFTITKYLVGFNSVAMMLLITFYTIGFARLIEKKVSADLAFESARWLAKLDIFGAVLTFVYFFIMNKLCERLSKKGQKVLLYLNVFLMIYLIIRVIMITFS